MRITLLDYLLERFLGRGRLHQVLFKCNNDVDEKICLLGSNIYINPEKNNSATPIHPKQNVERSRQLLLAGFHQLHVVVGTTILAIKWGNKNNEFERE